MRKYLPGLLVLALLAFVSKGLAQTGQDKPGGCGHAGPHAAHKMVTPDQVKWMPGPPSLPAGAQLAVLEGDPRAAGPFTIRLKFPDGFKVPPHWHPSDERVVVLQGALGMGTGEKFDTAAGHELPAGSYALMPAGTRHFAWAKGETVIQVSSTGPFVINYVNASDDPRKPAASK